MTSRRPSVAGMFYPADERSCRRQIEGCVGEYTPPAEPAHIVAGIVPHAGWTYSGSTAAKVFKSVKEKVSPETFLIFGAVHSWGVDRASMFAEGEWLTPCGTVEIDAELAKVILSLESDEIIDNMLAHSREHSIEVQIPFIQYFFPNAKILPIMISPEAGASKIGQKIGKMLTEQQKNVFVLGSTDLTHYGPRFHFTSYGTSPDFLDSMKENDQRIIDLVVEMKADEVIEEASRHRNACGAGAIAATIATAKELGATHGHLLEYITSQDIMPEPADPHAVGYAGIIF
jgi:AmmeMemoRadiSam system protein B